MVDIIFTSIVNAHTSLAPGTPPPPPPPPPPLPAPPPSPPRLPGLNVFAQHQTYEYEYATYQGGTAPGNNTDINAYMHEIQEAQGVSVDGFALYIINRADMLASVSNMFEAAKRVYALDTTKPRFLLFMSFQTFPGDVSRTWKDVAGPNWIAFFMETFAGHPNYYHYQGKAVLMSFEGLDQQSAWTGIFSTLTSLGITTFYVPMDFDTSKVVSSGTTLTSWANTNLGSIQYWTGSNPTTDISGTNTMSNVCAANGKPITINLSGANYWSVNVSPSAGVYFEHYGGEGPRDEWLNAIGTVPTPLFILETTWSDWTESYTAPVDIPNVPTVSSGYGAVDRLLKPHRGYSELRKYYAKWYTTGVQPTITKDLLIYFYRIAAQSANTHTPLPSYHPATIPDNIFVTTQLTAPATLRITTGGVVTTYSLPAGINYTQTAFAAGAQLFEVLRGPVIISISGENILSSLSTNNLQYTTGFAYAA